MESFADYLEEAFVRGLLSPPPTLITPVYLALATGPVTATSTGASMPEVANAHGYARQPIPDAAVDADGGIQLAAVTFPAATGSWGTITDWVLVDSPVHGMGTILAADSFPEALVLDTDPPRHGRRRPMRVETFAAIAKVIWAILQAGSRGHQALGDTR